MDNSKYSPEVLLRTRLFNKLHPQNFREMTDTMAAILGYLLDAPFTDPEIEVITVTQDGGLFADTDKPEIGRFLGHYADLIRSWRSLLRVAGLKPDERMLAESLFATKIGYFDGTVA